MSQRASAAASVRWEHCDRAVDGPALTADGNVKTKEQLNRAIPRLRQFPDDPENANGEEPDRERLWTWSLVLPRDHESLRVGEALDIVYEGAAGRS